jgi:ABC-2 type transport system permease protein
MNTGQTTSGWRVAAVLCRRELVRFVRQPAQVGAAIGTPILLWLFLGSGFASSFRPEGLGETSYAAFLLPGMTALVAVFTAIFASISIIEDRQQGWLQSVLVSPAPRWSIAVGKTAGGSIIAWLQAAILLFAAPMLGAPLSISAVLVILVALAMTCIAMTCP